MSGEPRIDGAGRFQGYRGIAKDVTASKRAELLLKLEHSVARCLAEADTAGEALQAVLRAICETEGWDTGRYFRVDEQAGVLRFSESWALPHLAAQKFIEGSRDVVFRPGVGLSGMAWQSGQPVWSDDTATDPRVAQAGLSRAAGSHGAFIFPVISDGKTLGVAAFSSGKVREPDERLLQAVDVIGAQIGQFVQRKEAEERVRYMATHDGLTRLPNRVMFGQMLSLAVATARRHQRHLAVLFVDLDRFKFVNDTLGHEAGDALLKEIAARFTQTLRATSSPVSVGTSSWC